MVVICLKNCTFVVSTTTLTRAFTTSLLLWFAWKIVPLWYQQQRTSLQGLSSCVVICLKNCTFVVSTTTIPWMLKTSFSCDLLEKLYLCGINNNRLALLFRCHQVVICLKNCTFVVSTTTIWHVLSKMPQLWFAWKIVPLWYQQQPDVI